MAIWFYLATLVTVAILHIFNNLELPVSAFKSYSIYAGVQDALVQWWYGHNAVAFFLTTPVLGLIFLKFADNKYSIFEKQILEEMECCYSHVCKVSSIQGYLIRSHWGQASDPIP